MWRKVFPELCSVLTQELHGKLRVYKDAVSGHKSVRSSSQELRTNSAWAGVGLTQARSAISVLRAHLQLYNFAVCTGCTWGGCKTSPQKGTSRSHVRFVRGLLSSQELPSCSHTPPHMHTQTLLQTAPKQRPKVHFPCLFFKLTAQLQLFKPFCIGGARAQLESTVGKDWRGLVKAWGIWPGSALVSQSGSYKPIKPKARGGDQTHHTGACLCESIPGAGFAILTEILKTGQTRPDW